MLHLLSVGAGLGKTTVIHCLYEALVRHFDSKPVLKPGFTTCRVLVSFAVECDG